MRKLSTFTSGVTRFARTTKQLHSTSWVQQTCSSASLNSLFPRHSVIKKAPTYVFLYLYLLNPYRLMQIMTAFVQLTPITSVSHFCLVGSSLSAVCRAYSAACSLTDEHWDSASQVLHPDWTWRTRTREAASPRRWWHDTQHHLSTRVNN